jgi:hypothetical protein
MREATMPLHLVKLCVGVSSIEELADWQKQRLAAMKKAGERAQLSHATFQTPKRQAELKGGSLYWVIKGLIAVRQPLAGFEEGAKRDGSRACLILLDRKLVPVRPMPRRAFQGWRYLDAADAPPDLADGAKGIAELPPKMRRELAELGLL